jgi:plastocyanin
MKMKTALRKSRFFMGLAAMILIVQSCASAGRVEQVTAGEHEKMEVSMTARSFDFEPSVIQIHRLGNLLMRVHNEADTEHNITVKDPRGMVIASTNLPPGKTVSLGVDLKAPGKYEFYCDKFLHATLGMKGEIVVTPLQK